MKNGSGYLGIRSATDGGLVPVIRCSSTEGSAAAALGRTAAVERNRGDILDGAQFQAGGLQRTDRGLTARAGSLDEHVDLLQAVLLRSEEHTSELQSRGHLVC